MNYYDISPELSDQTAVFPGDQAFKRTVVMDFKKGDFLVLSNLLTTAHLGAHVDAPNHYHPEGEGIEKRKLDYYLGPAQVLSVKLLPNQRITPLHLKNVQITEKRVLFKTDSFPDPNQWRDDFNSLSPELIDVLAKKGVILVGIDTPSIDLAHDKELLTHQSVYKNNLAILEGIVLTHVPDGIYFLIALPLKLKDADASPVRAILLKENLWKKS